LRLDIATPSGSRTSGQPTTATGRLRSAVMRRTTASCCASFRPKYAVHGPTIENSFATTNLSSAEIKVDPKKDKKGPLVLGAAGSVKSGGKEGRFVAVGSSNFLGNNILKFNGNRDLFLNIMNWLSSDEDLISIRPKDPEDRRLTLTSRQMSTIFSSSVIGLPLIVIAAGMMVWWKRR